MELEWEKPSPTAKETVVARHLDVTWDYSAKKKKNKRKRQFTVVLHYIEVLGPAFEVTATYVEGVAVNDWRWQPYGHPWSPTEPLREFIHREAKEVFRMNDVDEFVDEVCGTIEKFCLDNKISGLNARSER